MKKYKKGRLYRNPRNHGEVIEIAEIFRESVLYRDLGWPQEEFTIGSDKIADWELIEYDNATKDERDL